MITATNVPRLEASIRLSISLEPEAFRLASPISRDFEDLLFLLGTLARHRASSFLGSLIVSVGNVPLEYSGWNNSDDYSSEGKLKV